MTVVSVEPAVREQLESISPRYLPADQVDGYVDAALKNHGEQVVIRMRPSRWVGSDLGQV